MKISNISSAKPISRQLYLHVAYLFLVSELIHYTVNSLYLTIRPKFCQKDMKNDTLSLLSEQHYFVSLWMTESTFKPT